MDRKSFLQDLRTTVRISQYQISRQQEIVLANFVAECEEKGYRTTLPYFTPVYLEDFDSAEDFLEKLDWYLSGQIAEIIVEELKEKKANSDG